MHGWWGYHQWVTFSAQLFWGGASETVSTEALLMAEKSKFALHKQCGVSGNCEQEISLKPHILSQNCVQILHHDHAFAFI